MGELHNMLEQTVLIASTHYILLTPHAEKDIGKPCLGWWLVAECAKQLSKVVLTGNY